jgi:heptosyltransferase-1
MRVLLIKMSSLGDVVHALPAVTDAAANGVVFDWVVEEAFAAIPQAHPGVRRVLPIAWRRWRKNLIRERAAMAAFTRLLREERYDLVLDAQGLIKSAMVNLLGRSADRAGLNFTSAREPWSAFACNRRVTVPVGDHAVWRLRALFAGALDYALPNGAPDFGLEPSVVAAERRCLLLHGTTWASKHWPEFMWQVLARDLAAAGWHVAVPWGGEEERQRAQRIAEAADGVEVMPALSLAELGEKIGQAGLVVGVDSGLTHLAGAMGRPTVVIYGSTSAVRTGAVGDRVVNLQSALECSPCLNRTCRYQGEVPKWRGEAVQPACYAHLSPERVRDGAMALLDRSKAGTS